MIRTLILKFLLFCLAAFNFCTLRLGTIQYSSVLQHFNLMDTLTPPLQYRAAKG